MSDFTEADLPVTFHHEQMVVLGDGTTIRFETNGEAKDVYVGDAFDVTVQLFPGCDHVIVAGGKSFKLVAEFEDLLTISKV
jgi:hypothetical protein